jgi:conjugal transfer pilus assembly protein TraL
VRFALIQVEEKQDMAIQPQQIPRYVDAQPMLLFWELDELAPLILMMSVGILIHYLTYAILACIPLSKFVAKWKDGRLDGALTHYAFRQGVPLNKRFPNGLQREWIG